MIQKADFHTLKDRGKDIALSVVSALHEKKHRIHVYTGDDQLLAQELDKALWLVSDHSFIPHALFQKAALKPVKYHVAIGMGDQNSADRWPTLVHIADQPCCHIDRYSCVQYLIPEQIDAKGAARGLYRRLRDADVALKHYSALDEWRSDLSDHV